MSFNRCDHGDVQQLLDQNGIPIFLAISFCALCVGRKRFEHTWHYSKTSQLSPDKKKKLSRIILLDE